MNTRSLSFLSIHMKSSKKWRLAPVWRRWVCSRWPAHLSSGQVSRGGSGRPRQLGRLARQGSLGLEALQRALAQAPDQSVAITAVLACISSVSCTECLRLRGCSSLKFTRGCL